MAEQTTRRTALDAEAALATLLAQAVLWEGEERTLRDALAVVRRVSDRA